MKFCIKYLFFFIVTLCISIPVKATHLVGADMTYECLGNNTYEVVLNVYRDCGPNNTSGTGFDPSVSIRLYDNVTNAFQLFTATFDEVISGVDFVNTDPCLIIPSELCIEKGSYYFTVTIPDTTHSYSLNYQRCCFGANVGNIEDSQLMGINISATIPASSFHSCYSSPTFNNDPLLAMCVLNPLTEDLGAISTLNMPGTLEYSFFTPYTGAAPTTPAEYQDLPFVAMDWSSGYSATYPIESNPPLALGSTTGELTGYVNELGYFVMGTKVDVKDNFNNTVGSIERVFKYTVADCSVGEHQVDIESELGNNIQICKGDLYTFELGANPTTDSVRWTVDGVLESEESILQYTFEQDGVYNVVLHGLADSVECYDDGSFSQTVTVFSLDMGFKARTLLCAGEVNKFNDTTHVPAHIVYEITDWFWQFGDGQTSTSENPEHTYDAPGFYDVTLTVVMDNGCQETIVKENYIEVYDVEVDIESALEVCVTNDVPFNSSVLMPAIVNNPVVSYLWNFGDGNTSVEANPIHAYSSLGVYDVSLQIELQTGCSYSVSYSDYITVLDDYIDVDIDVLTEILVYPFSQPLQIESTTSNFDSVSWNMNDEFISNEEDLNYFIGEDYNEEEIKIDVDFFEGGCSIHKTVYLPVSYQDNIFIPNAFTPNGDGLNEGIKPVGRVVEHALYYKFTIYNRYGQEYFNSTDNNEYWMGFNHEGVAASQGVYVWTLEIITKHSGNYSKNGVVTLIK